MSMMKRIGMAVTTVLLGWQISSADTYMVIDVSGGSSASNYPVSYLTAVPSGGWTDEYKTTKIVLRKIPAGTFTMGSPWGELGRDSDETQHSVTLSKDFYVGVFEVTQKQWERVMSNWPSYFNNTTYRDSRPVEQVSYYDIRENPANSAISPNWPDSSQVHADSFMGKLRAKTGLTTLDLPTESQWEYACRAGTTTALNSGKNLTATGECSNMSEVGRYYYNHPGGYSSSSSVGTDGGTAKVGSYQANAYGLYDMHGNVWEWCLDWYGTYPGTVTDPKGASSGSYRVPRGGSWLYYANLCRSAYRISYYTPSYPSDRYGFRLAMTLPQYTLTVVSGTGGGAYAVGTAAAVTADAAPAGQVFDYWILDPLEAGLGAFFDPADASTTVTMPAYDVTLIANYTLQSQVETPTFNPDSGAHPGSSVNITVICTTEGATIHYTVNGDEPTTNNAIVAHGGTVFAPVPGILKAKAWKDGMNPSDVKSADYTEAATVATPTFDPDGGAHAGSGVDVTISCGTAGATIHYTTNGDNPTESSATVTSAGSVSVLVPGTLKAKAWKTGINPSAVKSASYTEADDPATGSVPVYRFYSSGTSESTYTHLWTINTTERDALMAYPSWQYEGIGWYALTNMESGTVPLYRLYEPNIRRHLYTINATEYVALDGGSWNGEDVQYFVYPTNSVSGTIPAYRFYHSENQNHHFTISENEKDTIVANPDWGYNYEGIVFYVFSPGSSASLRGGMRPAIRRAELLDLQFRNAPADLAGDYDGDGIVDVAVYDEATGLWHIRASDGRMIIDGEQWGGPGFAPVSGDYDGDGRNDLCVYCVETGGRFVRDVDGNILLWPAGR